MKMDDQVLHMDSVYYYIHVYIYNYIYYNIYIYVYIYIYYDIYWNLGISVTFAVGSGSCSFWGRISKGISSLRGCTIDPCGFADVSSFVPWHPVEKAGGLGIKPS